MASRTIRREKLLKIFIHTEKKKPSEGWLGRETRGEESTLTLLTRAPSSQYAYIRQAHFDTIPKSLMFGPFARLRQGPE